MFVNSWPAATSWLQTSADKPSNQQTQNNNPVNQQDGNQDNSQGDTQGAQQPVSQPSEEVGQENNGPTTQDGNPSPPSNADSPQDQDAPPPSNQIVVTPQVHQSEQGDDAATAPDSRTDTEGSSDAGTRPVPRPRSRPTRPAVQEDDPDRIETASLSDSSTVQPQPQAEEVTADSETESTGSSSHPSEEAEPEPQSGSARSFLASNACSTALWPPPYYIECIAMDVRPPVQFPLRPLADLLCNGQESRFTEEGQCSVGISTSSSRLHRVRRRERSAAALGQRLMLPLGAEAIVKAGRFLHRLK